MNTNVNDKTTIQTILFHYNNIEIQYILSFHQLIEDILLFALNNLFNFIISLICVLQNNINFNCSHSIVCKTIFFIH